MSDNPVTGKEPTPRELEILKILWDQGPGSVRVVHQTLQAREPDLAYNTVQTLLRIMEAKELVRHSLDGRTFVYSPRVTQDQTRVDTTRRLLDRVFDGLASQLVHSLLRTERITPAELDRMQKLIDEARRQADPADEGGEP